MDNLEPTTSGEYASDRTEERAAANGSIAHRIDRERRVAFVSVAGEVTLAALRAANAALLADSEFVTGMDVCLECRVVTSLPSPDELRELALTTIIHRAEDRYGRLAIVATTARSYEAVSTFDLFCEAAPERMAIFTDRVAAHDWLGVGRMD